jgi:hypothetical protein
MGNACFVVVTSGEEDRILALKKSTKDLVIGRHKSSDIQLQHITVSREHALFNLETLVLQNRSSKDDTILVNGKATTEVTLKSLDLIQIGVFKLIFFGAELPEEKRVHNGTSLSKLPAFSTKGSQRDGATFIMDEDKMQELQRVTTILKLAHLQSNTDSEQKWLLKDKEWVIGKGADIPIGGWFTGGRLAVIEWTGKHHKIMKTGLSSVTVIRDGSTNSIDKTGFELKENDQIQVGNGDFSYLMK